MDDLHIQLPQKPEVLFIDIIKKGHMLLKIISFKVVVANTPPVVFSPDALRGEFNFIDFRHGERLAYRDREIRTAGTDPDLVTVGYTPFNVLNGIHNHQAVCLADFTEQPYPGNIIRLM
jgi:hypothetical protein